MAAHSTDNPFDAVLIISFGGPAGRHEIRPFLSSVLRGRRVSPQRIEEVAHHYEIFDGVSPLTALTNSQAAGLRQRLQDRGIGLPVYVGMRNWRPLLSDVLAEMAQAGVRRAIGLIAAAHHSYSSCTQYKENIRDARRELQLRGLPDIAITYVPDWYDHPGFIDTFAGHVTTAATRLPADVRDHARLVFTAHSIPVAMARTCRYGEQLVTSARLVAEKLRCDDWALVYQSRSGRPEDPWLEPDIRDYLRDQRSKGLQAAIIVPIGFLCDHIEVLYDLDHEAAAVCRELGLPMVRAETVNDDPVFIETMTDVVEATYRRYLRYPPLPIIGQSDLTSTPDGPPR